MAAPDDLTTSTTGDSDRDTVPDAEGLILAYEALVWRAQELVWNVDTLYTKLGEIDIHNLDLVKEEEALEELQRELADHMRSCDALKDNTADDCSTDSMDLSSLAIKIAALRDKQQAFPGGAADNEAWQADLKRAAVGLQNGFDRVQAGLDRAKVVIRAVQDTPLDVARYRDGLRDHMYNGLDLGRRAISVAANDF
jgi:hypothetical protein